MQSYAGVAVLAVLGSERLQHFAHCAEPSFHCYDVVFSRHWDGFELNQFDAFGLIVGGNFLGGLSGRVGQLQTAFV